MGGQAARDPCCRATAPRRGAGSLGTPCARDSPAWRRYRILELRYQAGNDARSIQGTLAISKGEYYREHREAIQAVVDVLWERFGARNAGGEGVSAVRDQPRLRPRLPLPVPLTALIGATRIWRWPGKR